jgi:hypothetical protein
MDYEVRENVSHFIHTDYKTGEVLKEPLIYFTLKVRDLSKEELDRMLVVLTPIYEKHMQEEVNEEIEEYKNYHKRCHEQCKGGL